jgi:hypothetical protein
MFTHLLSFLFAVPVQLTANLYRRTCTICAIKVVNFCASFACSQCACSTGHFASTHFLFPSGFIRGSGSETDENKAKQKWNPNVAVEWPTPLLRIHEVPSSNNTGQRLSWTSGLVVVFSLSRKMLERYNKIHDYDSLNTIANSEMVIPFDMNKYNE